MSRYKRLLTTALFSVAALALVANFALPVSADSPAEASGDLCVTVERGEAVVRSCDSAKGWLPSLLAMTSSDAHLNFRDPIY